MRKRRSFVRNCLQEINHLIIANLFAGLENAEFEQQTATKGIVNFYSIEGSETEVWRKMLKEFGSQPSVDRGVTFPNLISFVFGRATKKKNLDSTMQQLRILGARSKEDLACTRIYSTEETLEIWQMFAEIDQEFNENIELLDQINKMASNTRIGNLTSYLIPATTIKGTRLCAPNKVEGLMRHFKSSSRILPTGFTPINKEEALPIVSNITEILDHYNETLIPKVKGNETYLEITTEAAQELLIKSFDVIESSHTNLLNMLENFLFVLGWLNEKVGDKVFLMQRYNHKRDLIRKDLRFDNAPDSGKDGESARAKAIAVNHPVLIMIHQDGSKSKGVPFFWPVLVMPQNMPMEISYALEK